MIFKVIFFISNVLGGCQGVSMVAEEFKGVYCCAITSNLFFVMQSVSTNQGGAVLQKHHNS